MCTCDRRTFFAVASYGFDASVAFLRQQTVQLLETRLENLASRGVAHCCDGGVLYEDLYNTAG